MPAMPSTSDGAGRPYAALITNHSFKKDHAMSIDDTMIETPEGPMTWAEWKKKNPMQVPSRRTKGKDLPNKIKTRTGEP